MEENWMSSHLHEASEKYLGSWVDSSVLLILVYWEY